ncbi:hypothetical protein PoB_005435200 [Plakobranchus ocellatus]|uniref:Uncharacterized protein n=1 Tax=Plakobranchus ocellatus TaxID=259542 RepID=A0AAV4C907_9GAST|nr:hypothetical protein PoB_005435200 [Plakobranchus ocellatus]
MQALGRTRDNKSTCKFQGGFADNWSNRKRGSNLQHGEVMRSCESFRPKFLTPWKVVSERLWGSLPPPPPLPLADLRSCSLRPLTDQRPLFPTWHRPDAVLFKSLFEMERSRTVVQQVIHILSWNHLVFANRRGCIVVQQKDKR